jgi:molybdopterin converting factor small subunit
MAEIAGRRHVELPWHGGSVADVKAAVEAACPALKSLLERSAVAIGDRYATATAEVAVDDDVAIIPPVSGG